ncbi:hypothetical protein RRG08_042242 [Elysia crispata]|uniref:Uncharacterized protein n=1 Tax=Elysia crispata TaxID=231223 RepID=A0AAE1ASP6_9GAST|nr:hypothetical protein RRG08_042242 [Elysia crispata]
MSMDASKYTDTAEQNDRLNQTTRGERHCTAREPRSVVPDQYAEVQVGPTHGCEKGERCVCRGGKEWEVVD